MSQHKVDRISPYGTNGTQLDDPRADTLKAVGTNGVTVTDLRAVGPRYNPRASQYGALGTGAVDDGPAIALAETAAASTSAGIEHSPGTYKVSARSFTRPHRFYPGAVFQPTGDVVMLQPIEAGLYPIFDKSLGGRILLTDGSNNTSPQGYVRAEWWKALTLTVAAPTSALVVSATQDTYGSTGMTVGHTYDYGYTYVGYDGGETLVSPIASIAPTTGFEVACVKFFGGVNCRAMAVAVYWRDQNETPDVTTTVNATVNPGDTTITGVAVGSFPSGGGFIKIGSEIIRYSGTSGATFTGCTRGAWGTTAATHNVGDTIGHINIRRTIWAQNGKSPGNTYSDQWGFCDMSDAHGGGVYTGTSKTQTFGVLAPNDTQGAAYPAVASAHDKDGTLLSNPATAPEVTLIAGLPVSTNFKVGYTFTCGDGTETALSPASSQVTTPSNGGCLRVYVPTIPSRGACSWNLYASTDGGASWHKQLQDIPLHYFFVQLNQYNSGGASPPTGQTCQSTISGFQQAWDCVHDSGGGRTVLVGSGQTTQVPTQLWQTSGNASGMRVQGDGGSNIGSGNQQFSMKYTGTQTGVVNVMMSVSSATFKDFDFQDPNQRCLYGLGFGDPFGGNNFSNVFDHIGVEARMQGGTTGGRTFAIGGIALQVCNHSRGQNSHTASEQHFTSCSFDGDAIAIWLGANQTANFRFKNPFTSSQGNMMQTGVKSMLSADVVCLGNVSSAIFEEIFVTCHGGHGLFMGDTDGWSAGGGASQVTATCIGTELDNGGPMFCYGSSTNQDGSTLNVTQGGCLNNLGQSAYDLYWGSPGQVTFTATQFSNHTVIDNYMATVLLIGQTNISGSYKRTTRFQGPFPTFPKYSAPIAVYAGGYACASDTGVLTELRWLQGTANLAIAALAAGAVANVGTVTVTGAAVGDVVREVYVPTPLGTFFWGVVTAANTVTVYQRNDTASTQTVGSVNVTPIVVKKIQ